MKKNYYLLPNLVFTASDVVGGKTLMGTIHTSVKKASPHDGHPTGMPLERKNINVIMFYIKVA
jgi:hypothetical protein